MWLDEVRDSHLRLSPEQLLIHELSGDAPDRTPAEVDPLDLDWSEVLLLALQNRVEGILLRAIKALDLIDGVPPSVMSALRRRTEIAQARYSAVTEAFAEVEAIAPALSRRLVVYRGVTFAPLYEKPSLRMVSDIDFVVSESDEAELESVMEALGFESRATFRGKTFVGAPRKRQIGCDYVTLDMHYEPLPRFERRETPTRSKWLAKTREFHVGGVECLRFDPDLEVVTALVHIAEYATSWVHVCLEDDLRLIKFLDLELHCAAEAVDGERAYTLAREFGAVEGFVLGLAIFVAVRGNLPIALANHLPLAAAVSECLDQVAIPHSGLAIFDVPISERILLTDRSARALRMVPDSMRSRETWHDSRGIPQTQLQEVSRVADRARQALASRGDLGNEYSVQDE